MTEVADGAWTILKVLTWSTDYLKDRQLSDTPRLDAELLLAHSLCVSRMHLYTHFDKPLTVIEREPFKQFLMRRGSGEPVAYITGVKEFMGLPFTVNKAVLIPRPDTELLVETAMHEAASMSADLSILDIGTGSGCIAIALAVQLKNAQLTAWDVDAEALTLARVNAERHGVERINFQSRDALDLASWQGDAIYDLIVSNPPYIGSHEEPSLPRSVAAFEPHGALFADDGGLAFYRTFALHAAQLLKPQGKLIVEVGFEQSVVVSALLRAAGWQDVTVKKDYAKLDRVVMASRPERSDS